jgi:hypothetical protein
MAITKTWYINQMEAYPEKDGLSNVVFTIHWTVAADDGNGHRASSYGSVGIQLNPDSTYTPFEEITEAQAIEWVKNSLGEESVTDLETKLDSEVNALINPSVVTPPLPWMNTPVLSAEPSL